MSKSITVAGQDVDAERYANFQAANHGYGDGAAGGYRLGQDWEGPDAYQLSRELIANPGMAHVHGQRYADPALTDYMDNLERDHSALDKLTPERRAILAACYRAGWDCGFAAELTKAAVGWRDRGPE